MRRYGYAEAKPCTAPKGTDVPLRSCRLATQGVMDRRSRPTGPFARVQLGRSLRRKLTSQANPKAKPTSLGIPDCLRQGRSRRRLVSPLSPQSPVGGKALSIPGSPLHGKLCFQPEIRGENLDASPHSGDIAGNQRCMCKR